ncbi:MAG: erythromycin esterase family protein [Thaumarchaeota archaeon]|nr:MAG: erythromycin esterase family protein [Nitrososphaerota archaeon]
MRTSTDLRPLFEDIKSDDVDYVLLGEASHEPSDFYRWRTEITTHTTHLISNDGFSFIVVEGTGLIAITSIVTSKDCLNLKKCLQCTLYL